MESDEPGGPAEAVAGLMAVASMAVGAWALVERPAVIAPGAVLVALVAAGIGGRHAGLARLAVYLGAVWWVLGMTFAIWRGNSLY
jgi:hypothetical protein